MLTNIFTFIKQKIKIKIIIIIDWQVELPEKGRSPF